MANAAHELGKLGTEIPNSGGNGKVPTPNSPIDQKPTGAPSSALARHTPTTLPTTGFLRLKQIIGDPKANPPVIGLIPVSKSTWWDGVRTGRFPASVHPFGLSVTMWRVEDILALIERG